MRYIAFYIPRTIYEIDMAKVELNVIKSENNYDSTKVPLTESQMNTLGNHHSVLSGDKVTVIGPEGSFIGYAHPDSRSNGDIPLSPVQMSEIGAVVDSNVTVKKGKHKNANLSMDMPTIESINSTPDADTEDTVDKSFGDVTYDDVGGLDSELNDIRQMVELPLRRPDLFEQVGVDSPKGVLMHGPPGTGKTLIAQAIANQTKARFTKIDGPEIMSKYTGESEQRLRKIFKDAREFGTAIIFFDEIDSIGTERGDGGDAENRLVGQLLSLMDGIGSDDNVIVIGATNRVDSIDPALRRSGRFDREILIGAPNEFGRKEILDIHTKDMSLSDDVDIDALAAQTNGFVGADLAALSREAALDSIQNSFDGDNITVEDVLDGEVKDISVTMEQFNHAMSCVEPTALRSMSTNTPSINFDDVGGLEDEKLQMEEIVAWPIKRSKLFNQTNTDSPAGVIIHGENGVGKTLLAKVTAGEFDINFTRVNGASIFQKYVGESEEQIEDLFNKAEQASPVIIFFEQLDAIAGMGMDSSGTQERVISQLLVELDAIRNDPTITVIGETTNVDNIDSRLLQSGRFEEQMEIGLPDGKTRREIMEVLLRDKPIADDIQLGNIIGSMDEYNTVTGGNLESIVRNASLQAIREHAKEHGDNADEKAEEITITKKHFDRAINRVLA